MSIQTEIETKVINSLQPLYLDVINESNRHNVAPGSESHFKLVVVTSAFENKNRVARHRQLNKLLATELANGIHALSLQLFTPAEWEAKGGQIPASPPCRGGAKREPLS